MVERVTRRLRTAAVPKGQEAEALNRETHPVLAQVLLALNLLIGLLLEGEGSPEGTVTASVGKLYINTTGGAGTTLWVKESGAEATGWVAK